MAKFLAQTELYKIIKQNSQQTKNILWVCSPKLSKDAHKVFSQEITKNSPTDTRFIFQLNDNTVKHAQTNPYEIQYLKEHIKNSTVKTSDNLSSNLYIFDNSVLLTSDILTQTALENNQETGILLTNPEELEKIKTFFNQTLWQNAKSITDLQKHKKNWNYTQKTASKNATQKKNKPHTQINDWTDETTNTWYIGIPDRIATKNESLIKKQTSWPTELFIVGDVGYGAFKQLKLGDILYLTHLYKKHGKINIELARIYDKRTVETDDGDLHLACQVEKKYVLEREQFYDLLKNLHITSRSSETMLESEQLKLLTDTLASIKKKRKKKTNPKNSSQNKKSKQKIKHKKTLPKHKTKKRKKRIQPKHTSKRQLTPKTPKIQK